MLTLKYNFNMDNLVVLSISAAVVYFFVKFIEMRFIKRESEPLKGLIKDSAFLYLIIFGLLVREQLKAELELDSLSFI